MPKLKLTFYLVSNKYIYYSFYATGERIKETTGLKTDKGTCDIKKLSKSDEATANQMKRIEVAASEYVADCRLANKPVTSDAIRKIVAAVVKGIEPDARYTLNEIIEKFVKLMGADKILYKGKKYSQSAKDLYKYMGEAVNESGKIGRKFIGDIKRSDLEAFKTFMVNKETTVKGKVKRYTQNTVSIYNNALLTTIKRTSKELKWHDNKIYLDEGLRVPAEIVEYNIANDPKEILAIYNAKVTDSEERYRDVYVFGTQVGLRHSDFGPLEPESNFNRIISLNNQKGLNKVQIPVSPLAQEIWDKYGGKLPKVLSDELNKQIKNICKRIEGFDTPCLFARIEGGKQIQEHRPKWRFIGSHTMRRSFATNAVRAGIPKHSVMKITGHKTEESFDRYIRIDQKENAETLLLHPHFQ